MNSVEAKLQYKRSSWVGYLIALSCILSNLSQLDFFVNSGTTQIMNYPGWILLIVLLPLYTHGRFEIKRSAQSFYLMIILIVFSVLVLSLTGKSYLQSSAFTCLLIATLIYSIGYFYGEGIGEREIKAILVSYVVSAFIVAIFVYIGYFRNVNFSALQYEYSSKNSLAQIVFTSIVILWGLSPKKAFLRIAKYLAIVFMAILTLLLRSRATMLSFAICIIYIICGKNISKRIKRIVVTGIILAIIFFLFNNELFEKLLNYSVFIGRKSGNIDELSSGRLTIIRSFPTLIGGHLIDGIGATYFECFPLSCILQFGIVVGLLIVFASYSPLLYCRKLPSNNVYVQIFIMVSIGYIINSLFEGLAPIGPGVKCYFMWLLFGIFSNSSPLVDRDKIYEH